MSRIDSIKEIEKKIKTIEDLETISSDLKRKKKKIVTNNGSYDIIHIGHIISLFEAKKQGDVLIVGLKNILDHVGKIKSIKDIKGMERSCQELVEFSQSGQPTLDNFFPYLLCP
jgi:D-beta-D-heptose 7-phosphate kinase/D-beta-D-heptose 1-phosphate adenosyltransferase